MKKWDIIENVEVEKLVFWGKGFLKLKSEDPELDWRTIFITGWAIPGAIVDLRLLKKRKNYFETQIVNTIKKSPIEKKHPNNVYWECGGCKWVNIPYEEQLKIKQEQVKEAFHYIQKKYQENIVFESIIPSPIIDWYRNKVEFSFWKYISARYNIEEHFNVWFHKQWEFSKIQDFDWCILIDELQNKIYKEIKDFSKTIWLPVYDQMTQKGFFRHILIRRTYFMDEIMLLLSFNPEYFIINEKLDKTEKIDLIKNFLIKLSEKYPNIKSIYLSHNVNKADVCIWDLELIYWSNTIKEKLLGLTFNISPTSFFQTNSTWAEALYSKVLEIANKDEINNYTILDLYAWTWTIGMIFAKAWAKKVYSVELVKSSSINWEENAKLNNVSNMIFKNKRVEDFLWEYIWGNEWKADLLIIDPPRVWMHPDALPNILKFWTKQIIYVSCNPSTLTRDLEYILSNSNYYIDKVIPMDMFPHTHHIETIVSLIKK